MSTTSQRPHRENTPREDTRESTTPEYAPRQYTASENVIRERIERERIHRERRHRERAAHQSTTRGSTTSQSTTSQSNMPQITIPQNTTPQNTGAMLEPRPPRSVVSPGAVRSLQQQYELHSALIEKQGNDIARLEKKLEEMSNWLQVQLNDLITRISNLSQSNSDMFAKQTQLSYDLAKTRFGTSCEVKKDVHEMRTEINGLLASFSDLNSKVDICLQRLWDSSEETFLEYQRRVNERLDDDLMDVRDQLYQLKQLVIRLRVGLTIAQPDHALSYIREPQNRHLAHLAPTLNPSSAPGKENIDPTRRTLIKQKSTPQFSTEHNASKGKLGGGMVRSASAAPCTLKTPNAFKLAKEAKAKREASAGCDKADLTGGVPQSVPNTANDPKAIEKRDTSVDGEKRWRLFGLRRRQASVSSGNTGKFPWSGRRQKESNAASVPPVPSIPQDILRIHEDSMTSSLVRECRLSLVHPLLRPPVEPSPVTDSPSNGTSEEMSPTVAVEKNTADEKNSVDEKAVDEKDAIVLPSANSSSPLETGILAALTRGSSHSSKEDVSK